METYRINLDHPPGTLGFLIYIRINLVVVQKNVRLIVQVASIRLFPVPWSPRSGFHLSDAVCQDGGVWQRQVQKTVLCGIELFSMGNGACCGLGRTRCVIVSLDSEGHVDRPSLSGEVVSLMEAWY